MRDCETRQAELKAYQDGELPLWKRLEVRLHLARCAVCREELKAMQEVSEKLRHSEDGGLDPALRARILASVTYSSTDSTEQQRDAKRPKFRPRPLVLWGAAAAGVLLGLCYRIYFIPNSSSAFSADRKASAPAAAPGGAMQEQRQSSEFKPMPSVNAPAKPVSDSFAGKTAAPPVLYQREKQDSKAPEIPVSAPGDKSSSDSSASFYNGSGSSAAPSQAVTPQHNVEKNTRSRESRAQPDFQTGTRDEDTLPQDAVTNNQAQIQESAKTNAEPKRPVGKVAKKKTRQSIPGAKENLQNDLSRQSARPDVQNGGKR